MSESETNMTETLHPEDASDIRTGGWIDRLPTAARPYMYLARFDRPYGAALLLLPCWWSVALASEGFPSAGMLFLFLAGALLMRGAGCVVNDIADRNFDGQVARTALRPIPSGQVSVKQALVWLALLSLIGLVILLQFNTFAVWVGVASLVTVVIYPYMKRFTYWPQFFLGISFNWGALLGWAAVRGELSLAPGLLYVAGILWTLGYDTIYAHQDKDDDALIGLKSTALKLGDKTKPALALFWGGAILLMGGAAWVAGLHWAVYPALIPAALHLLWQGWTLDIDDPKNCLHRFKSNRNFGLLVFAAFVVGQTAERLGTQIAALLGF